MFLSTYLYVDLSLKFFDNPYILYILKILIIFIFRTKFFEFDQKPVCKNCYDKFPPELKKRLKKAYDEAAKLGKSV